MATARISPPESVARRPSLVKRGLGVVVLLLAAALAVKLAIGLVVGLLTAVLWVVVAVAVIAALVWAVRVL